MKGFLIVSIVLCWLNVGQGQTSPDLNSRVEIFSVHFFGGTLEAANEEDRGGFNAGSMMAIKTGPGLFVGLRYQYSSFSTGDISQIGPVLGYMNTDYSGQTLYVGWASVNFRMIGQDKSKAAPGAGAGVMFAIADGLYFGPVASAGFVINSSPTVYFVNMGVGVKYALPLNKSKE